MVNPKEFAANPALAAIVNDVAPAWLWSPEGQRIVWANKTGLKLWGHESLSELAWSGVPNRSHGFRHLDRLGEELEPGKGRIERLRFFRFGRDLLLTCKVAALEFDDVKYLLSHSLSPVAEIPAPDISDEQNIPGTKAETDTTQEPDDDDAAEGGLGEEPATNVETPDTEQESLGASKADDEELETEQGVVGKVAASVAGALAGANVVPFRNAITDVDIDPSELSGEEQEAFEALASALGSGDDSVAEMDVEFVKSSSDENLSDRRMAGTQSGNGKKNSEPPEDAVSSQIEGILSRLPVACIVYRVGVDDDYPGEALFASRAYLELLGYESLAEAEASGGLDSLLPVSLPPEQADPPFMEQENGQILKITRADKTTLPVMARLRTVNWSGKPAMMMTIADRLPEGLGPDTEAGNDLDLGKIFVQACDAALLIDDDGRIMEANIAAKDLFNLEGTAVHQLGISDLIAVEGVESSGRMIERLIEPGMISGLSRHTVTGKVRSGADIPLQMSLRPFDEGHVSGFCATFVDVSQWQKEIEAAASRSASAEGQSEQKSEFLAALSHELRTSLNTVLGFSEAILEERFGPLEHEHYAEYVLNIHESGAHLLELVNDMLDLSKVESGNVELNFTSVEMNEIMAGVVKLMQPEANKSRIIIRSNFSEGIPEIVADEQSLRQIGLNLISNAVKYTGPGGQVIVSTRMTDEGQQQLRIRDTGRGMTAEELQTALEPFGRAETVRGEVEGSGLGLPITKALIEANRAEFNIESAEEQGTLVEVTFPVNRVLAG